MTNLLKSAIMGIAVGRMLYTINLPIIGRIGETKEDKILREHKEDFLKHYYNDLIQTEYVP